MVHDGSLDELLPRWHFREHHRRTTNVPPSALLAAVEQLTWADVRVLHVLMRIRSAGRLSLARRHRILDDMVAIGFVVLDRSRDELVLAALRRPWARGGGAAPRLADQSDPACFFVEFGEPGWATLIRRRWLAAIVRRADQG